MRDAKTLERLYDRPVDVVRRKELSYLDRHCRRFIDLSPLAFLCTAAADGACDVSPRGDPPGFAQVLDEHRLALPDRKGNNRLDSLHNVLENPNVGLLFVIPGIDDVLRVNGHAQITVQSDLLAQMSVNGRPPLCALVIEVQEAYLHCGRAFKRAHLWDPDRFVPRNALPPLSDMLAEHARASRQESRVLDEGENAALY